MNVRYGSPAAPTLALDGVDLEIRPGEVVGVTGAEGAGKSSLLRVLGGWTRPQAGDVTYDGFPTTDPSVRRRTGYGRASVPAPPDLSVAEWLTYLATYRVRSPSARGQRVRMAIDELDLAGVVRSRVGTLPQRAAQRLSIAAAVLCGDRIVLADALCDGLDPGAARLAGDALARAARRGAVVVTVTSDLATLERIATRVIVLERGRVTRDRQMAELMNGRLVELTVLGAAPAVTERLVRLFHGAVGSPRGVDIPLTRGLSVEQILAVCRDARIPVAGSRVRYRRLDDVV